MKLIIVAFLLFILGSSLPSTIFGADIFYLTFQWPGSKCHSKESCCYNGKEEPASRSVKKDWVRKLKGSGRNKPILTPLPARDFVISRMEPNYFNGTWPKYCNSRSRFNLSKIKDLVPTLRSYWPSLDCPATESEKLWSREWKKYGTCTETILDQHQYFATALKLQRQANVLKVLKDAAIYPNGASYEIGKISDTIIAAGLHQPGLACNKDKHGNLQLDKIILCTNYNGTYFVECPGNPMGSCIRTIKFSSF